MAAAALAREDSRVLTVLGAGKQAMFQIAAATITMPGIRTVYVADQLDKDNERAFAAACRERLERDFGLHPDEVEFLPAGDLAQAVGKSDVIITITPSRAPVIQKEWVRSRHSLQLYWRRHGGKEEIDPELFREARIFADDADQCARWERWKFP